jgi:hypothetical protein
LLIRVYMWWHLAARNMGNFRRVSEQCNMTHGSLLSFKLNVLILVFMFTLVYNPL